MSFPEKMLKRSRKFALNTVVFCRNLMDHPETFTIRNQLIKSSTSVAANYRAACRARSKNEWYAKLSIVVEEIDESNFWLGFIADLELSDDSSTLERLINESEVLLKIFSKSRATAKKNKDQNNYLKEPEVIYYSGPLEDD